MHLFPRLNPWPPIYIVLILGLNEKKAYLNHQGQEIYEYTADLVNIREENHMHILIVTAYIK